MREKIVIVSHDRFVDCFSTSIRPENERDLRDQVASMDIASQLTSTPPTAAFQNLISLLDQRWLLPDDEIVIADRGVCHKGTMAMAGLYHCSEAEKMSEDTQWTYVELLIECRTDDPSDPFSQEPWDEQRGDGPGLRAQEILEYMLSNAILVFNSQHRIHLFTILISGAVARFIRWDRVGYVVSESFEYVSEPWKLVLFLWRFARMSPEQRGQDMTAVRIFPGSAEYELMQERAMRPKAAADGHTAIPGDHARALFENSVHDSMLWRLRVDDTKKGPQYFLVGKPHYCTPGLAGRGTQTFVAIDEADPYGPFVYLKDAWRVTHTGIEQEGKILERLNSDDDGGPVPYVPTIRCHGDVEHQGTRFHKTWREKHAMIPEEDCTLKARRHYRLVVVNEVGRPLSLFKNMKELVGLVTLCLQAHGEAYNRKKLIHRDISAGNVLIYPELVRGAGGIMIEKPKPLLADWELAQRVDDPEEAPRQPNRTGTWQFMSANALSQPSKRILVQDDVESFVHLVLYHAIRFIPHNCPNVGRFMEMYFDGYIEENGVYYGGKDKLKSMENGELTTPRGIPLCFYVAEYAIEGPFASSPVAPPPTALSIPQTSGTPSLVPSPLPSSDSSANGENASHNLGHVVHPVTKLLEDCLLRLKAHYTLYVPQESTDVSKKQSHVKKAADVSLAVTSLRKKREPTVKQPKVLSPADRAELEILAAKLADHSEMIDLFAEHYEDGDWPDEDRCPDQLPEDYKPNHDTVLVTGGSKRTAGSAFETSVHQAKRSRISGV